MIICGKARARDKAWRQGSSPRQGLTTRWRDPIGTALLRLTLDFIFPYLQPAIGLGDFRRDFRVVLRRTKGLHRRRRGFLQHDWPTTAGAI